MRWKLNTAKILIPQLPYHPLELLTLAWNYFELRSKYPDCCKLHSAQVRGHRTQTRGLPVLSHRSRSRLVSLWWSVLRPVWTQQGCAVAQTHTAELMEPPMLRSAQTGWRYWTLTTRQELRPGRLLSPHRSPSCLPLSVFSLLCVTMTATLQILLFSCHFHICSFPEDHSVILLFKAKSTFYDMKQQ